MGVRGAIIVAVLCLLAAALVLPAVFPTCRYPSVPNLPFLQHQVAMQEEESAEAVANYVPKSSIQIDDLDSSIADLLRQLPGVAKVESSKTTDKPTSRIIHLRDWHFLPKALFAQDVETANDQKMSPNEIDRLYQEFLLEVDLVQIEQIALLRCLIKHHGLKAVYSEGLSPDALSDYQAKIAVLRSMEREQMPVIRQQLEEARKLGDEALEIQNKLQVMLDEHKVRMLEIGAAGRLLVSGELDDVLPLEETVAYQNAQPLAATGEVKLDPATIEARHDAQVKAVLDNGTFGLIVLGAAHDLTESVGRLGGGKCEYVRVTTKWVEEMGE